MMSTRDDLITACAQGDELTVRRLEWWPIKEALGEWWWSREPFTLADLTVYVRALGSYPPDVVMAALPVASDKWRPLPGPILAAIHRQQHADGDRPDTGRNRHRAASAESLAAVRAALDAGEAPCGCGGPSAVKWVPDAVTVVADKHGRRVSLPIGAWRCPHCGGLEPGQVYAAEDAGDEIDSEGRAA